MKKIIFLASLVFSLNTVNAQTSNTLLQQDFWKQKPTVEAVKAEIAKGNSPSELDGRSMDPTSFAINNEAPIETIKFMLTQEGNGLGKGTHHSRTYLHWAAGRGNVELVNYLISKGSDIEKGDSYGYSPLVFAATGSQQNTALYDVFFKAGVDAKKKYKNGETLLLLGVSGDKDLKLTNYFISKGLSLDDIDSEGATAFDYAAKSGNIELLKTLASKGVKPTHNALVYASIGGRASSASLDVYKYLVEDLKLDPKKATQTGNNVLHAIVRKPNQDEIINYFLAKGVDVNKANAEGNTPFMNAAAGRNLKLVELLSAKVKDINAVNEQGESALALAVTTGSPEVVSFLISKGANVKIEDKAGHNLGYYLVQSYRAPRGQDDKDEFTEKANILASKGLNLSLAQKDGSTLYHAAIAKSDLGLLKKLNNLKINVNAKNKEGMTVLHRAALIAKDDEILKYLVTIGADKAIKTEFDETAYDLASENEFLTKKKVAVSFLK
ncbi:MAG: ankyrin repeat domain-containing protein [Pedobacter sp.]|nr:MAG: ankyrin repeat domain-containing protein [Pedobacter sp.]